jgi:ATP-dependent DNA helicase RecQ
MGKDVFANLPTGYGKSTIPLVLPKAFDVLEGEGGEGSSLLLFVAPTSSLMTSVVALFTSAGYRTTHAGTNLSDKVKSDLTQGLYQVCPLHFLPQ